MATTPGRKFFDEHMAYIYANDIDGMNSARVVRLDGPPQRPAQLLVEHKCQHAANVPTGPSGVKGSGRTK